MAQLDKKERILNAALNLFIENGIDNTSTSLITKEANVATGTLYLYFKNKAELINELYISVKEEFLSASNSDISDSQPPHEFFEKLWIETVTWGINNTDKFRFMLQFHSSPYYTEQIQARFCDYENKVIEVIKKNVKNEQWKDLPPEFIYEFLSAHLLFTVEYVVKTNTEDRMVFFKTFLDGIKKCE